MQQEFPFQESLYIESKDRIVNQILNQPVQSKPLIIFRSLLLNEYYFVKIMKDEANVLKVSVWCPL